MVTLIGTVDLKVSLLCSVSMPRSDSKQQKKGTQQATAKKLSSHQRTLPFQGEESLLDLSLCPLQTPQQGSRARESAPPHRKPRSRWGFSPRPRTRILRSLITSSPASGLWPAQPKTDARDAELT
ncbi:hypothetical protein Celaphus_00012170 [Cervus elaphus hippelaphus]|uniref:Uncharacterized protein n=1 Tax=Cervus elaphus hippelaphus TaxID=46360 RepID=A0A212CJX9_CEREH|nr:hypothetical protein Celaphus_00012170 [Cervus elaphus hippelaphus]